MTRYLFHPIAPILVYLLLAITTLHIEAPFLVNIHIEALILALVFLFTTIQLYFTKEQISYNHLITLPAILGLLFIITPIITSLINQDHFLFLQDEEYKTLFKMVLFGPILFYYLTQKRYQFILLNTIIFFYFIFGLYFLYRYLILHEVRDFDLRPLLKIRHGDANFLCTFFAMMTPLSLMQGLNLYKKNKIFLSLVFNLVGFFFLFCAYLTESRMGIIASLAGIIYLLSRPIWPISKNLLLSIFLFLGSATVIVTGDRLLIRFIEIKDKSNFDRILTWKNGWQVFQDNPLFGAGIHQAKFFFYQNTQYPAFQSEFNQLDVHNTFLKVLAELGLIGFVIFMMFFLWPWKKIFQMPMPLTDRYFLLCSLGILTICSMTIGIVYKDLFVLHLFIIAGLTHTQPQEFISK